MVTLPPHIRDSLELQKMALRKRIYQGSHLKKELTDLF